MMALALQVTDTAGVTHCIPFTQIFRITVAPASDTQSRGVRQYIDVISGSTITRINAVTAVFTDQITPVQNFGSLGIIGTITGQGYVQFS